MSKSYIDPHVHCSNSLLDGMIDHKKYVNFAKENNLSAIFITEHGNINGWIDFYKKCKEENIKPILGSEVYLSLKNGSKKHYHLNLYAKNEIGYKNLIKLITYANMENFYRVARVDIEALKKYSEGLVCSTACVGSIWGQLLKNNHYKMANNITKIFKDIFGDDFYIEYGYHEFEDEKNVIPQLYKLAKKNGIKTIIGNDSHYLYKEEELAHKILMCKGDGKIVDDNTVFNYSHNYYKTMDEIKDTFNIFPYIDIEQCNDNVYEIIDKCNVEIEFGKYIYPLFTDSYKNDNELLIKDIKQKVKSRYKDITKEVKERIKTELQTILKMKFSGYFLLVADYVNWAKNNDVFVGVGRGSGCGSIICYILGITDVDPLQYDLLFERFLNPARVSFPDIDTDFDSEGREKVLKYLKQKYGEKNAIQISTKGMLNAKAAIKTIASRLGLNYQKFNLITSKIKDPAPAKIEDLKKEYPELEKSQKEDQEIDKVFNIVKQLQGNVQSIGKHAGGVAICHEDISNICPIIKDKGEYKTAWSDKEVESLGLIKFDILGLKNLSIIKDCLSLDSLKDFNESINYDFNNNLPFNDEASFNVIQSGDTSGIFQLGANFVKGLTQKINPQNLDDLAIINACNRPGVLDSGLADSYILRKNGLEDIDYLIPEIKPYVDKTYGLPLFQEQILFLFRLMAGFTLAEADLARRAIGKKLPEEMDKLKDKFVNGSIEKGHSEQKAIEVFNIIEKFSNYGFNKCIDGDYLFPEFDKTLKELYNNKNKPVLNLFSFNTERLSKFQDSVKDIIYTGKNHVFNVKFNNGKTIPVTMYHKFLCTDGKYHTVKEIYANNLEIIGE